MQEIRDMERHPVRHDPYMAYSEAIANMRFNKEYALGFAFNEENDQVLLITKNRPAWQKGRFNGVGGHVETGEAPRFAMAREFAEEAGVIAPEEVWDLFAVMHGIDWPKDPTGATACAVFCYETQEPSLFATARTMTDEPLVRIPVAFLRSYGDLVIPNLHVLIPLALSRGWFQRPAGLLWARPKA